MIFQVRPKTKFQIFCFLLQMTFDPDKQRGLVDVFLRLQYKNGEQHLTDEQIMGLIIDAIAGGTFVFLFFFRVHLFVFPLFVLHKNLFASDWKLMLYINHKSKEYITPDC